MTNGQMKDFFETVATAGPIDKLDIDRAVSEGRRRRRIRAAATLGSAAAVILAVGGLVVTALPHNGVDAVTNPTGAPATEVKSPAETASTDGTQPLSSAINSSQWAKEMEPLLPSGTKPQAVLVQPTGQLSDAWLSRATFLHVGDGRVTDLVVTAYGRGTQAAAGKTTWQTLLDTCGHDGTTCDPVRSTQRGDVLIRHFDGGSRVQAINVRKSGRAVSAESRNDDISAATPSPGSGAPGLADDIDALISLATTVPEPMLADANNGTAPSATVTPTSSPTVPSPVVSVTAGQKVDLGSGSYLTVTSAEKCVVFAEPGHPSPQNCTSLTDGNQGPKSISVQAGGSVSTPFFITGVYTGMDASNITVTVDGPARIATIVKLGSHPTSLVYYLAWPTPVPGSLMTSGKLHIEAFDSAGRLLARS